MTAEKSIKIEIWSDVVCPYCYIGKHALDKALEDFRQVKAQVIWRSFLLDPDTPAVAEKELIRHLEYSKGIGPDQAEAMMRQATEMASRAGLDFHLDQVKVVSSRDAHQLIHFAATRQKAHEVIHLLFRAYFSEGKNIADYNVLQDLAARAGLDGAQALEAVTSQAFQHQIDKDIHEARMADVRGVPFFLFNGKRAVPGALPASSFRMVLQRILDHPE